MNTPNNSNNIADIERTFRNSVELNISLAANQHILKAIGEVIRCAVQVYRDGGKVFFCGNGGSAAQAQHLAAELSGKFYKERAPLFAEALHVNSSYLTAVANDLGYAYTFSRLLEAFAQKGDLLIALTTSGSSENVIKAVQRAKSLGVISVVFAGEKDHDWFEDSNHLLKVPSSDTARIQEAHLLMGHIICEGIEKALF